MSYYLINIVMEHEGTELYEWFTDYIVCEEKEFVPNNLGIKDSDIFYYGVPKKEAIEAIGIDDWFIDFTILAVNDIVEGEPIEKPKLSEYLCMMTDPNADASYFMTCRVPNERIAKELANQDNPGDQLTSIWKCVYKLDN